MLRLIYVRCGWLNRIGVGGYSHALYGYSGCPFHAVVDYVYRTGDGRLPGPTDTPHVPRYAARWIYVTRCGCVTDAFVVFPSSRFRPVDCIRLRYPVDSPHVGLPPTGQPHSRFNPGLPHIVVVGLILPYVARYGVTPIRYVVTSSCPGCDLHDLHVLMFLHLRYVVVTLPRWCSPI